MIHHIYAWSGDPPGLYDEFSLPMLYALKYLKPVEIETWVKSIIEIKNHAWRLGLIVWWLALDKFLQAASQWPQDGELENLLDAESSFITTFWTSKMSFASLDALIPHQNLVTFQAVFAQHLTYVLFQSWVADITSHRTLTDNSGPIPIDEPALEWIEQRLGMFRQRFFHNQ